MFLVQLEGRFGDQEKAQPNSLSSVHDREAPVYESPNKVSEDIVRCLSSIFLRMSTSKARALGSSNSPSESVNINAKIEELDLLDPYNMSSEFAPRDVGPYKHLCAIEVNSVDVNRKTNALFLIHRLK